jgi:hypothetical protein
LKRFLRILPEGAGANRAVCPAQALASAIKPRPATFACPLRRHRTRVNVPVPAIPNRSAPGTAHAHARPDEPRTGHSARSTRACRGADRGSSDLSGIDHAHTSWPLTYQRRHSHGSYAAADRENAPSRFVVLTVPTRITRPLGLTPAQRLLDCSARGGLATLGTQVRSFEGLSPCRTRGSVPEARGQQTDWGGSWDTAVLTTTVGKDACAPPSR